MGERGRRVERGRKSQFLARLRAYTHFQVGSSPVRLIRVNFISRVNFRASLLVLPSGAAGRGAQSRTGGPAAVSEPDVWCTGAGPKLSAPGPELPGRGRGGARCPATPASRPRRRRWRAAGRNRRARAERLGRLGPQPRGTTKRYQHEKHLQLIDSNDSDGWVRSPAGQRKDHPVLTREVIENLLRSARTTTRAAGPGAAPLPGAGGYGRAGDATPGHERGTLSCGRVEAAAAALRGERSGRMCCGPA